jgi:hypothetical protein
MPRRAAAPWTVVTQGTSISYDSATLLDKLEYVISAAPTSAAVTRTLAQDDFVVRVTVRISNFPFQPLARSLSLAACIAVPEIAKRSD